MVLLLGELVDLVWPRTCAGCAAPGVVLCPACRGGAAVAVVDDLTADPGVALTAAGAYAGGLRRALIAYKERGRHELARPLGALLRAAVDALLANRPRASPFDPPPWSGVVVTPVPSTPAARRARGGEHVARLATAAARPRGTRPVALLTVRAERRDAAGLGIADRLAAPERYRARPAPPRPPPVLLVDDIVTTGATARDAVHALRRAGWPVLGVAVVAATPRATPRLPPGPLGAGAA